MNIENIINNTQYYICESCNYKTNKKSSWGKHIRTFKHNKINSNIKFDDYKKYTCNFCENSYKHHSSLWSHKKKCILKLNNYKNFISEESFLYCSSTVSTKNEKDLIFKLLEENKKKDEIMKIINKKDEIINNLLLDNKEFKNILIENMNNITINTNCNNKTQFNLNLFLNETCKNAMNIDDFIKTIEVNNNDLEDIGKLGYIQGVSNIFIKALKGLNETERPLHCTDKKREIFYVKDNNVWEKENDKKERIRKIIRMILHENSKYLNSLWKKNNPLWEDSESKKHKEYMNIIKICRPYMMIFKCPFRFMIY